MDPAERKKMIGTAFPETPEMKVKGEDSFLMRSARTIINAREHIHAAFKRLAWHGYGDAALDIYGDMIASLETLDRAVGDLVADLMFSARANDESRASRRSLEEAKELRAVLAKWKELPPYTSKTYAPLPIEAEFERLIADPPLLKLEPGRRAPGTGLL